MEDVAQDPKNIHVHHVVWTCQVPPDPLIATIVELIKARNETKEGR